MKFFNIVISIALVSVLFVPKARTYVSSLIQSTIIDLGFVNSSGESNKQEKFDFNFHVKDLSGADIDFKKYERKVIFLNIWATWCGPCRSEMPSIQKLFDEV